MIISKANIKTAGTIFKHVIIYIKRLIRDNKNERGTYRDIIYIDHEKSGLIVVAASREKRKYLKTAIKGLIKWEYKPRIKE